MIDDRNRALCEWLGIPAKPAGETYVSGNLVLGVRQYPVYPDLATREGFWLLWEALPEPPHSNWNLIRRGKRGDHHAYLEGFPPPGERQGEIFAEGIGLTPWAALFEAAWELMQREVGNG